MIENNGLSENNTLYTDMVLEIMGSWVNGDFEVIETVTKSIASEMGDNDTVMPGLLFGALMHMGVLIAQISSLTGDDMEKVWTNYLHNYLTETRKNMVKIPVLHPKFAEELAKKMDEMEE